MIQNLIDLHICSKHYITDNFLRVFRVLHFISPLSFLALFLGLIADLSHSLSSSLGLRNKSPQKKRIGLEWSWELGAGRGKNEAKKEPHSKLLKIIYIKTQHKKTLQ